MNILPIPAKIMVYALQWNKACQKINPKTLEEMLRAKDAYIKYASKNN